MSNLIKPYEISVWDDVWDSEEGKFVEKRLQIIGTDEMLSQNKALEPVLTRNVNGVKKLSFKMYKRYIDRETGDEVTNPFIDYLVSERKVKLKYDKDEEGRDIWYDFIVKNINETSTTYLYQFDLEDAIVQELSKNGFGVTLDAQLNNNMGTADELAEKTLADTDWDVEGSDKLVQEVKEHLVYVSYIQDPQPETLKIYMLKNSGDNYDSEGVEEVQLDNLELKDKKILAFYSSCTGKPHRFQFIILPDYIETNEDNVIVNKDCQYFIECEPDEYTVENSEYGFILPSGWAVQDQDKVTTEGKDTTVSHKYRGNRFGYAQQAVYLPKLDRYVNKYTHTTYGNIYGYVDNEYVSPVLMTNLISNTEFKNTSGWKGVAYGSLAQDKEKPKAEDKPTVENVYGTTTGTFVSAMEHLSAGSFNSTNPYEAYMKLTFPESNGSNGYVPAVINNGPYDNRTLIGKIAEGEEWALYVEGRTADDLEGLTFTLEESDYVSGTGCYAPVEVSNRKIEFEESGTASQNSAKVFKFNKCNYNEKNFKKQMRLRVVITCNSQSTHYIKTIELHKVIRDKDNKIIRLNAQADKIDEGVVNTQYFYFTEEAYDAATTKDEIKYVHTADKAEPSTYKPVYNAGAEKIRSVTAKESNYFNILQSIAETFEAWLDLKITRDASGSVTSKTVSFKKYAGGDNYAAFRYGVNLKDITRTTESKQIVTKLIVKNNSNELAQNKFCTIQRAPSNISGENYIYDFQYYHNMGLLQAGDYLNELYYTEGAIGSDIPGSSGDTNIRGYFPRLKALNNRLVEINEQMSGLSQELLQLKAEREVAEATYDAAESGIEQTSEDFETLTGFSIDAYNIEEIPTTVSYDRVDSFEIPVEIKEPANHKLVYVIQPDTDGPTYSIIPTISKQTNGQYKLSCTASRSWAQEGGSTGTYKVIRATYYICAFIGGKYKYITQNIKAEFEGFSDKKTIQESKKISDAIITSVDTTRSDINKLLTEYLTYQQEKTKSGNEKTRLATLIDGNEGKQKQYDTLKQQFEDIRDNQKSPLNKAFFRKYSRFIQEGTWIDEQYVDDEKYYNDAQTVLYNSCYPKVGYTINVLSLSEMPGYELFKFDIGEKTYAEDEEFFGTDSSGYPNRMEIIITEMSNHLENPSADSIKVQNFKNQFQDLFQKITATVQQTQYNEGTYRKGAALVEATNAKKNEFLLDSLSDPASVLSNAGQNEVVWDNAGITVMNKNNRSEQLRLVSSGIMFSTDSESGPKWSTGITPQGISANKVLAGSINTGEISLMNGKDASFLWNAFGINAFDYTVENGIVAGVNKNKFVRFDRNGIYGINGLANADTWTPEDLQEVDDKATFALTWEGLKVTGDTDNGNNVVARIGKSTDNIINITNNGSPIFAVSNDGTATFAGNLSAAGGTFAGVLEVKDGTKNIFSAYGEKGTPNNRGTVKLLDFTIDNKALYKDGDGWNPTGSGTNYNIPRIWNKGSTPDQTAEDGEIGISSGGYWAFWAGRSADGYGTYASTRIGHWGDINTQVLRIKPHAKDNLAKKEKYRLSVWSEDTKYGFISNGNNSTEYWQEFGSISGFKSGKKYKVIFKAVHSEENTGGDASYNANLQVDLYYNQNGQAFDGYGPEITIIGDSAHQLMKNNMYYIACVGITQTEANKDIDFVIRFFRAPRGAGEKDTSTIKVWDITIVEDTNDQYLPHPSYTILPDGKVKDSYVRVINPDIQKEWEQAGLSSLWNGEDLSESYYAICNRNYWTKALYGDWQVIAEGGTLDLTGCVLNDIQAKSGTIAGLVFDSNSLYTDDFTITPQQVWFKNNGQLVLGDSDTVFCQDQKQVIIYTTSKKDLVLKNASGAGIVFKATPSDQKIECIITITPRHETEFTSNMNLGYLYFDYKITSSGSAASLIYDKFLDVYYDIHDYGGSIIDWEERDRGKVKLKIPAHNSNGTCTIEFLEKYEANTTLDGDHIVNNNTAVYLADLNEYDALNISWDQTNWSRSISYTESAFDQKNNILYALGSFCPDEGKAITLGDQGHPWEAVVAKEFTRITSDKNVKNSIEPIKQNFDDFFDYIEPVSYRFNHGTSGRFHLGFIAQQIEESLVKANIDLIDFAGICIDKDENQNPKYYVRYGEFIALNTDQIQKLKPRVSTLEQTILNYESRISNLEQEIAALKQ